MIETLMNTHKILTFFFLHINSNKLRYEIFHSHLLTHNYCSKAGQESFESLATVIYEEINKLLLIVGPLQTNVSQFSFIRLVEQKSVHIFLWLRISRCNLQYLPNVQDTKKEKKICKHKMNREKNRTFNSNGFTR